MQDINQLNFVYDGWDGYNRSLIRAIEPLTEDQLAWRFADGMSSVGEIAAHIAFGRIGWFAKMNAPGSVELSDRVSGVAQDAVTRNASAIVDWLNASWAMIEATFAAWTVDDLAVTYEHEYYGNVYAVSRQWTMWRILSHDMHHGGQLSLMLIAQGIATPDLVDNGGHVTELPVIRKRPANDTLAY